MPEQQQREAAVLDREVTVAATVLSVTCPKCGYEIEGFVMDPRNADSVSCDECGAEFKVPQDAHIVFI